MFEKFSYFLAERLYAALIMSQRYNGSSNNWLEKYRHYYRLKLLGCSGQNIRFFSKQNVIHVVK